MPDEIHITATHEKWRFRCLAPERYGAMDGHTNWFPIDGVFRCAQCAEEARTNPEVDPEYDQLFDKRSEQLVSREAIDLDVSAKPSPTGV